MNGKISLVLALLFGLARPALAQYVSYGYVDPMNQVASKYKVPKDGQHLFRPRPVLMGLPCGNDAPYLPWSKNPSPGGICGGMFYDHSNDFYVLTASHIGGGQDGLPNTGKPGDSFTQPAPIDLNNQVVPADSRGVFVGSNTVLKNNCRRCANPQVQTLDWAAVRLSSPAMGQSAQANIGPVAGVAFAKYGKNSPLIAMSASSWMRSGTVVFPDPIDSDGNQVSPLGGCVPNKSGIFLTSSAVSGANVNPDGSLAVDPDTAAQATDDMWGTDEQVSPNWSTYDTRAAAAMTVLQRHAELKQLPGFSQATTGMDLQQRMGPDGLVLTAIVVIINDLDHPTAVVNGKTVSTMATVLNSGPTVIEGYPVDYIFESHNTRLPAYNINPGL